MTYATIRGAVTALVLAAAVALAPSTFAQDTSTGGSQGPASGSNPTARAVSEDQLLRQFDELRGRVSIPDPRAAILQQPQGREYQQFHESTLPWIAAALIIGMLLVLAAFYFTRGRIRLEQNEQSGRKILRFNAFERFTHWMTAGSFIVLAITGLNYIFGKRLLMPIIGPDAFATWSQYAKYAHNFLAWPFILGIVFMIVVWIRDNVPDRTDIVWLKEGGGLLDGRHPPARRFNAGQKMVFWSVIVFGLVLSVSGIIMLFPFSTTGIDGMQLSQVIHATAGVIFISIILAHIYIGTLGMEGAYDAMGTGEVDLAWAEAHHKLWVEEEHAKTASGPQVGREAPAE